MLLKFHIPVYPRIHSHYFPAYMCGLNSSTFSLLHRMRTINIHTSTFGYERTEKKLNLNSTRFSTRACFKLLWNKHYTQMNDHFCFHCTHIEAAFVSIIAICMLVKFKWINNIRPQVDMFWIIIFTINRLNFSLTDWLMKSWNI